MKKLIVLALLAAPALALAAPTGLLYKKGRFYFFEGNGRPPADSANKTQRLSLSEQAAVLDGKAKIARYIDGLKTKDDRTLAELKEKDDAVKTKVKVFLDGVETVKTDWDGEDNCKVILKINRKNIIKSLNAKE
ncbi:MAG: hypothetical protein A3A86_08140 [Elusimicrobia bacterium RIFCSPLOWO2_01_FULL_60_11]|nr:MAG: hypothetical protein A3A86_08140 [Elusimicrobia bacterium RIFCSPLOWO2_01_FULL_60_11]